MTRETKVGMVVAGSFLCLVGVVVASKLGGGGNPNKDAVVQGSNPPATEQEKGAKPAAKNPPGVLPASLVEEQSNPPVTKENPPPVVPPAVTPPAATNPPPLVSVPTVPTPTPKNIADEEEERVRRLLAQNAPKVPGAKEVTNPPADPPFRIPDLAQNDKVNPPPAAPPKVDGLSFPKDINPPAVDPKKFDLGIPPPVAPPGIDNPGKKDPPLANPPAVNPPVVAPPAVNPPAVNPPAVDKKIEFPLAPPPVNPPAVEKKDTPPLVNPPAVNPPAVAPPAVNPPVGNPPAVGRKDDLPPIGSPPAVNPPSDPGLTIIPRKDNESRPFDLNPPAKDVKPFSINPPPVGNNPPLGAPKDEMRLNPTPANPAFNNNTTNPPALGSERINAPPLDTKPITPSGGNLPRVTSFDVETYLTRPEDATFAGVSQRLYGSDKYSAALLQYNREHALAKDNVRQEPPRLTAGTPLYIPPKDWLQTKYPNLVAGNFNPPPLGALNNPPALGASNPPAARISAPTVGTPTANPTTATADPTKRYVVRGAGQHIIEIAQQTLGDGRRWAEIYRLNPSIQPQQPIPGGTELRLPDVPRTSPAGNTSF